MRAGFLTTALSTLAVLAVATPAKADFVNTWQYTVTSTFSNATDDGQTLGTLTQTPTRISWGPTNGAPRSAIGVVDTPTDGFIDTNGDFEAADDYFHDNFVIPLGSRSLASATLSILIELTPFDPAGAPNSPISTSFDINFTETTNNPAGGICANGEANGSGINSSGCADIFVLDFDEGQFDFTYDGFDYSLFLFEDPTSNPQQLGFLSAAACAAAGAEAGCFGFLTAERLRTVAEFVIQIEGQDVDVPEPAALGVFGLGLLGLGAVGRRRKA